jgi:hypothetical protein
MSEKQFWLSIRRLLLSMAKLIELRFGKGGDKTDDIIRVGATPKTCIDTNAK